MRKPAFFLHYILLALAGFGYFAYLFVLETSVPGHSFTRPNFNLLAPLLLALAATLYLMGKPKYAAVPALMGLTIASRDILSNWFVIQHVSRAFLVKYFLFLGFSNSFLLFLFVVVIKSLFSPDNASLYELPGKTPGRKVAICLLSMVPMAVIVSATVAWLIAFWRC